MKVAIGVDSARESGRRVVALLAGIIAVAAGAGSPEAARPRVHAIEGARIVTAPGEIVESGTLVIRDGLIEASGAGVKPPPDAVIIDGSGRTLHAGFIDACSSLGLPAEPQASARGRGAAAPGGAPAAGVEARAEAGAFHPVSRIRPERRILDRLAPSVEEMAAHRKMGFTAALVVPTEGIFRGTSALVAAGDGSVSSLVIRPDVAQHVAFERGRFRQPYPTSLMGSLASIRQGFEDARRHAVWQARWEADPAGLRRPATISAWAPLASAASGAIPVAFDVDTPDNALRALALARELGLDAMLIGSGHEGEVAAEIARSGAPVILPMAFPERPAVEDEGSALEVDTLDLERFLAARTTAAKLAESGVRIAFGTCRMKKKGSFTESLRAAIEGGLGEREALAALTTGPARLFGVERSLGTLEAGRAAHVVMRSGSLFGEDSRVERVWVDGVEHAVEADEPAKPGGEDAGAGGAR